MCHDILVIFVGGDGSGREGPGDVRIVEHEVAGEHSTHSSNQSSQREGSNATCEGGSRGAQRGEATELKAPPPTATSY